MSDIVKEFNDYRERMNDKILSDNNKVIKRIFNLDTNAFSEGALDVKTKELLGLVASAVLRCDDCVKYHLETYIQNIYKNSRFQKLKKSKKQNFTSSTSWMHTRSFFFSTILSLIFPRVIFSRMFPDTF